MEFKAKSYLYLTLIFLTSALAFNTYLTQEFLGLNEFLSEGLPLIIGFLFILLNINTPININITFILYLIYISYLTIITLFYIVVDNHNYLKLIFLYQYIPFLIIASNFANINQNRLIKSISQEAYKIICIFASISAVIGVLQFFNISDIVPIDINRARGLSRSTLNYSSLLFLAFICANQLNQGFIKKIFISIIYIGLLASQGRGGIFAATIYFFILYGTNIKKIIIMLSIIFLFLCGLIYIDTAYIEGFSNILILKERLINGLSMENDVGNSLRIITYSKIIDEFNIYGIGVGSTGPAAERIQPGTGYESFTLALIAQGGIVGLLIYALIGIIQCINYPHLSLKNLALILAFFFMMSTQQTFETPAVNIMAWIVIILSFSANSKEIKNV